MQVELLQVRGVRQSEVQNNGEVVPASATPPAHVEAADQEQPADAAVAVGMSQVNSTVNSTEAWKPPCIKGFMTGNPCQCGILTCAQGATCCASYNLAIFICCAANSRCHPLQASVSCTAGLWR